MSAPKKISVLIVEDSALMRILLTDILKSDPAISLVGAAHNGKEGVEKATLLRPDVIVTDMIMPDYDGLYLVNEMMKRRPVPIIVLSALDKNNVKVFDALQLGAFDFLDKPKDDISNSIKAKNYPLLDLIKAAVDFHPEATNTVKENHHAHTFDENASYNLIVIGASTGGPAAIENLLKQLPSNLNLPVIIAQHMPPAFIESYAKRLNTNSPFEVKVAFKGEELLPGKVYLTPGDANFKLKKNPLSGSIFFGKSDKHYSEFNNPSIDCMMESTAKVLGKSVIGVILTGMGKDGSQGLKAIKESGGMTIVQDEHSSVVYGMPKNAWDIGAANHAVSLEQMGGFIVSCL